MTDVWCVPVDSGLAHTAARMDDMYVWNPCANQMSRSVLVACAGEHHGNTACVSDMILQMGDGEIHHRQHEDRYHAMYEYKAPRGVVCFHKKLPSC